jgi:inosine-uridine nucleoside N-ribohydrolase
LKLVVDCDPGHDDAVALMLAHQCAEVVGITTVSGNATLENTTRNALNIVELIGADTPVHSGAARPLVREPVHAGRVHGDSGLGGVVLDPPQIEVASNEASEYLLAITREVEDLWIVAVGPLTNLALAIQQDPGFASRVAGVSIMGGSADVGNVTRVAEFNIWADPEAADVVFRSGANLKMCGLNLTHQLKTDDDLIEQLRASDKPVPNLAAKLFEFMHGRMAELVGERRSALHDPCAVLALTHADLLTFEERAVDVETTGTLTRGMTVVDERTTRRRDPANAEVAYHIEADRAMAAVVEALLSD